MTQNIIEIKNLSKRFSSSGIPWKRQNPTQALLDVNIALKRGECLGLLGPNGAGKTTLLKIISTLILADSGSLNINGYFAGKNDEEIKSLIGLTIPEERSFYWRLTGRQNLECFAALYGLDKKETSTRLEELFKLFKIDYENKRFDAYSAGMKRKFSLIRTLLHDPEILLLDEPTKSLDYNSAYELREYIRRLNKEGKTVIFATHNMEEARDLCTSFAILQEGKIYGSGTLEELRKKINSANANLAEIYLKLT